MSKRKNKEKENKQLEDTKDSVKVAEKENPIGTITFNKKPLEITGRIFSFLSIITCLGFVGLAGYCTINKIKFSSEDLNMITYSMVAIIATFMLISFICSVPLLLSDLNESNPKLRKTVLRTTVYVIVLILVAVIYAFTLKVIEHFNLYWITTAFIATEIILLFFIIINVIIYENSIAMLKKEENNKN
jgi:hypothetical protein